MLPQQANDLLMFGSRVALDLFTENYRPRGDLRRWTVIERAERACGIRMGRTRWEVA